jgi:hypothetical protein
MTRTSLSLLLLFASLIAVAAFASAQSLSSPASSVLGPHAIGGRGCVSCHTGARSTYSATSSEFATTTAGAVDTQWGTATTPFYGTTIAFSDGVRYVRVSVKDISARNPESGGILICLSCHDGNLEPPIMMGSQSFEQILGMFPGSGDRGSPAPTLLGSDTDEFTHSHPVGASAVIPTGQGLVWTNNGFSVTPGTPYASFVDHYGRPSLMPGTNSTPWGVNSAGQPFVLCTTCHNQHMMSVYASSATSQIAGDGGGKLYPTVFFVNGPYAQEGVSSATTMAPSATQFCRQCHFGMSNEANNTFSVPTDLRNY